MDENTSEVVETTEAEATEAVESAKPILRDLVSAINSEFEILGIGAKFGIEYRSLYQGLIDSDEVKRITRDVLETLKSKAERGIYPSVILNKSPIGFYLLYDTVNARYVSEWIADRLFEFEKEHKVYVRATQQRHKNSNSLENIIYLEPNLNTNQVASVTETLRIMAIKQAEAAAINA